MNVLNLPLGAEEDESVLVLSTVGGAHQIWCKKGKLRHWHRLRGPAYISCARSESWYRNDEPYEPTAHEKMMWELRKKNECS